MSLSLSERLRILRSSGGFFSVSGKSKIGISGKDRERYLNGQVTIDISKIPEGSARQALLLTVKGKLCAPLWIWKDRELLVVEVDADLRDETMARLERYIISDDVVLSEFRDSGPVFHVFGTEAPEGKLRINRLGVSGFDTETVPADLLPAEPEELEILRIERRIPKWGAELDSDTLPQEAGLEATSVEFDKGCYVGQEVVSRLKSVGRVNRHLFQFVGVLEPPSGERLFLHLPGQSGGSVGVLTSICRDFELAQTVALGYLNRQFEEMETFDVADAAGKVLGKFEKRPILT